MRIRCLLYSCMGRYKKAVGIILKKHKSKEADQFLVVFTKEFGKLYLFAKGAHKLTSRRLSTLDSLNLIKLNFWEKRDVLYIKEADLLSSLETIKTNYQKRKTLLFLAEILDKLLPVGAVEEKVFNFSKKILVKVATGENKQKLLESFVKLLAMLGYKFESGAKLSLSTLKSFLQNISEKEIVSLKLD